MSRTTHRKGAASKNGTGVTTAEFTAQDIFFPSYLGKLCAGQRVEYDLVKGPQGQWYAINITVIEEPALN